MNIAINGFGRIGRTFYRAVNDQLKIIAINDLGDVENLKYLLKYDTVYGKFDRTAKVRFLAEKDPEKLPWKKLGVELVIESTGFFTKREEAKKHLQAGAKKVLITAPSSDADVTIIPGVNEDQYDSAKHHIISMGSCTTNCIVPLIAVLNKEFKIAKGFFTTIHSYTSTQALVDRPDKKDFRRGRSGAENIVPTTTGAAKAIFQVFPELQGRIDALSIRVPSPTVSLVNFVCQVEQKRIDKKDVNEAFRQAVSKMRGALAVSDEPLVSSDYRGSGYGAIVDSELTTVTKNNLVQVVAWYDNEMGYSHRLVELCKYIIQH